VIGPMPWWLEEALAAEGKTEDAPALAGDIEVDVAVVGGGYAGLWTALMLREKDPALRVALFEADRCGFGPSGRNGGILHAYWTKLAGLHALFGRDGAREVAHAAAEVVPAVRAFADTRGEDIWLDAKGVVGVSAAPAQDAPIAGLSAAARAVGLDDAVVDLGPEDVARLCRSPAFRRGIFIRDAATIQPARLARALRRAAIADGVQVYERTPVRGRTRGRRMLLHTAAGRVHADRVVYTVGADAARLLPLSRQLTNFGSYIVLTEPAPDVLAELGWRNGPAFFDGRMFVHYFRTTPDGRIAMGSGSGPIGVGGRVDRRFFTDRDTIGRAERGLRRLLPAARELRVTHAWGGPIDVSSDHEPFFGTFDGGRVHYGAGFSGHGIGPAWLAGQILSSLALDRDDRWSGLPLVDRVVSRLPPEPLRWIAGSAVRRALLACEHAEELGRRPPVWAPPVAALPRRLGLRIGTR
jgi:glycine/D-amino acid oxidase-like deaminating enzyme